MTPLTFCESVSFSCLSMYDGWNLVLALLVSATLEETQYNVTPQPVLSCDVHGTLFGVKSYQDFSIEMNKIMGAELNQI